jgi:hypothetical protein
MSTHKSQAAEEHEPLTGRIYACKSQISGHDPHVNTSKLACENVLTKAIDFKAEGPTIFALKFAYCLLAMPTFSCLAELPWH